MQYVFILFSLYFYIRPRRQDCCWKIYSELLDVLDFPFYAESSYVTSVENWALLLPPFPLRGTIIMHLSCFERPPAVQPSWQN